MSHFHIHFHIHAHTNTHTHTHTQKHTYIHACNPKLRNATELSKHIWDLEARKEKSEYDISWKLISSATPISYLSISI